MERDRDTGSISRRRFIQYLAMLSVGGRTFLDSGDARAAIYAAREAGGSEAAWPEMSYRKLGRTDIEVSAVAMGCWAIVGDFSFEGDNIDLVVIRDPAVELTPDKLADVPLAVTEEAGQPAIVPLGELVHFVQAEASQSIRRVEQRRAVEFTVNTSVIPLSSILSRSKALQK